MKKLLISILLCLMISTLVYAGGVNPGVKEYFVTENTVAFTTAGKLYQLTDYGYVNIFALNKCYISLVGATPNATTSAFLNAGTNYDTEAFYSTNKYIGLLSDSGTANVVISIYRYYNE